MTRSLNYYRGTMRRCYVMMIVETSSLWVFEYADMNLNSSQKLGNGARWHQGWSLLFGIPFYFEGLLH